MDSATAKRNDEIRRSREYLRFLERRIERQIRYETGCCGVTMSQCHVLLELDRSGASTAAKLAEELRMDKGALSKTVESLVRKGYLRREGGREDRRRVFLQLTEEGQKQAEHIHRCCDGYYHSVFRHLDEGEMEEMLRGLELAVESMRRAEGEAYYDE